MMSISISSLSIPSALLVLASCAPATIAPDLIHTDPFVAVQRSESLSFPFRFQQMIDGQVSRELNLTAVMRESEPAESSCDVIGTWVAYAHRINGGKMSLVGESILVFNDTHWARIQAIGDDVFGSAGTYGVVGDSLSWHGGIGARGLEYSEACWIDADGLHLANKLDPNALRETDYRRVK